MYFHSDARRSAPSSVRAPHTTTANDGKRTQAIDPKGVELAILIISE